MLGGRLPGGPAGGSATYLVVGWWSVARARPAGRRPHRRAAWPSGSPVARLAAGHRRRREHRERRGHVGPVGRPGRRVATRLDTRLPRSARAELRGWACRRGRRRGDRGPGPFAAPGRSRLDGRGLPGDRRGQPRPRGRRLGDRHRARRGGVHAPARCRDSACRCPDRRQARAADLDLRPDPPRSAMRGRRPRGRPGRGRAVRRARRHRGRPAQPRAAADRVLHRAAAPACRAPTAWSRSTSASTRRGFASVDRERAAGHRPGADQARASVPPRGTAAAGRPDRAGPRRCHPRPTPDPDRCA